MSSTPLLRFGKGQLRVGVFRKEFASLIKLDEQGRDLVHLPTWVFGQQWSFVSMRGASLWCSDMLNMAQQEGEKNVGAIMSLNN